MLGVFGDHVVPVTDDAGMVGAMDDQVPLSCPLSLLRRLRERLDLVHFDSSFFGTYPTSFPQRTSATRLGSKEQGRSSVPFSLYQVLRFFMSRNIDGGLALVK